MENFTLLMITYTFLDNVLVAISYYIGHEKEFTGEFPFRSLICATATCMGASEICAIKKKRTISPAKSTNIQGNNMKKMVISNLPENSDWSSLPFHPAGSEAPVPAGDKQ